MAKRITLYGLLLMLCLPLRAADNSQQGSGLTILDQLPTKNQIPLLDNRFRIDDNVDSITLVFFRRQGTASIVLVRPDGSKVFYNTAKDHDIRWYDAANYDLIEINNPMPGPWQALGRILPESRVLVLTDVQLKVDPLPNALMVGENFKLTARLMDGDKVVNARDFREILTLQVLFVSTNKPDAENYGRGMVEVTTFRDDGRGFDASARDGIFTGEVNLNFGAGEWVPRFILRTPLYTREVEHPPVYIVSAPVSLTFTQSPAVDKPHLIKLAKNSELVDEGSLLFQGTIRYPDGDIEQFAITDPEQPRVVEVTNKGPGSYLVNVSTFGQMTDGREFMLNLPEERFLVLLQTQDAPPIDMAMIEDEPEPEPEPAGIPWLWILLSNIVILGGGAAAIWAVMNGKKMKDLMFWKKKKEPIPQAPSTKESKEQPSNKQKDDIMDLSLPDD